MSDVVMSCPLNRRSAQAGYDFPYVFERVRPVMVGEPFLLIEGTLQHQDGVVSVRAERMAPLIVLDLAEVSRDFH